MTTTNVSQTPPAVPVGEKETRPGVFAGTFDTLTRGGSLLRRRSFRDKKRLEEETQK